VNVEVVVLADAIPRVLVAVNVNVAKLALGTAYGLSDARRFGAQFSGAFTPTR